MDQGRFRRALIAGHPLVGTFMKTPALDVLEVLIHAGLDFVCLDGEHGAFDRGAMNQCGAVARASGLPLLVRVPSGAAQDIGAALDLGATGVVVPHVTDAAMARDIARAARFGPGGRGFAGSTRWAGFGAASMADLLARSAEETVVIAQIEDPEALAAADAIAATDGIDALFLGPADLSVALGKKDQTSAELHDAFVRVGQAARSAGKGYATFVPDAAAGAELVRHGVNLWFVASEQAWIIAGARAAKAGLGAS
jgi:2-keto-3-deoxy-L-rhamnonate aldolase RhmA